MKMLKAADFDKALQAFCEEDFDTAVAPFAREQSEILEFITGLGGELSEEDEIYLELTALNTWRLIKAAGFTAAPVTREIMQALHLARLTCPRPSKVRQNYPPGNTENSKNSPFHRDTPLTGWSAILCIAGKEII